ncbi:MAG: NlpC/P60 family protein [Candidatus Obscuribacterales bacterium]|nr:NlpC/P60 family protein [Candidatus Obscuribacterales bacterium]
MKIASFLITVAMAQVISPDFVYAAEIDLASVTADFAERDALPESPAPRSSWYRHRRFGSWGPPAAAYPQPSIPPEVNPIKWQRARVIAVAEKYIGLPYKHHHIPGWSPSEGPGLDCSNFTSWVYNYGLGYKFNSNIHMQADGPKAPGRRLEQNERFMAGDLLYILRRDRSAVSHVVIYIDEGHIIDSHNGSVQTRPFTGWYRECLSHARRIIE